MASANAPVVEICQYFDPASYHVQCEQYTLVKPVHIIRNNMKSLGGVSFRRRTLIRHRIYVSTVTVYTLRIHTCMIMMKRHNTK